MSIPEVTRKTICAICEGREDSFVHRKRGALYKHKFKPRKETKEEALYRTGYEEGWRDANDRNHWGSGWD